MVHSVACSTISNVPVCCCPQLIYDTCFVYWQQWRALLKGWITESKLVALVTVQPVITKAKADYIVYSWNKSCCFRRKVRLARIIQIRQWYKTLIVHAAYKFRSISVSLQFKSDHEFILIEYFVPPIASTKKPQKMLFLVLLLYRSAVPTWKNRDIFLKMYLDLPRWAFSRFCRLIFTSLISQLSFTIWILTLSATLTHNPTAIQRTKYPAMIAQSAACKVLAFSSILMVARTRFVIRHNQSLLRPRMRCFVVKLDFKPMSVTASPSDWQIKGTLSSIKFNIEQTIPWFDPKTSMAGWFVQAKYM